MPPDTISVKLEIKNQKVREEFLEVISSVEGFQVVQRSYDPAHVDLLIFEIGSDLEKEFQLIHSLQGLGTVGEVFLTSPHSDPAVLVQAIRTGAKEFFSQPINREEVRQALERFEERRGKSKGQSNAKKGLIINVTGAKGGVGTTTIAVNLAVSLAKAKSLQSVALIDMNLLFGETPLFLDIEPTYHWGEIAKNILSRYRSSAFFYRDPESRAAPCKSLERKQLGNFCHRTNLLDLHPSHSRGSVLLLAYGQRSRGGSAGRCGQSSNSF